MARHGSDGLDRIGDSQAPKEVIVVTRPMTVGMLQCVAETSGTCTRGEGVIQSVARPHADDACENRSSGELNDCFEADDDVVLCRD